MEYVHYEYHVHQKPSIVNFTWPQPATLLGFDQTNPNETSLHAMRITTRNYTVVRRKRKKERKRSDLTRVTNLCSRRILHSRVQLSASLHENATPASCVEPMILVNFAPSRVVDRHRERGGGWQRNIDTVKFNGLIYDRHKSSVTSCATQVSRILLSPRSTLALLPTLPSIFTCSARFSFCPPFFVETGERAGIINGEEINCWRAIRRRFVWSVHDARFTAWIETRINYKAKDIEEFKKIFVGFFFFLRKWRKGCLK